MKKNILLFGALIGAFLLVSCSGGNKKQAASSVTPEELDNASKVINYYHTSLIVLRHVTRVRDNILKSKEQKNIQPTKGGHKMVTCQNYVSLFYRQITSCPSDGGIS